MVQKKERRKEFIIRIGPQLKLILDKQLESIREVTYGVVKDSYWEAGEILALKFKGEV